MQLVTLWKVVILSFSCLLGIIFNSQGQYNDPNIAKPTSGYGADGDHPVGVMSFKNPNFNAKNIEVYYPSDVATQVPTIFYSHAFGGNDSGNIIGMLDFVASKGYAIVYVPYQTTGVTVDERYTNLAEGFTLAVSKYPNIIDTTRVGFMGHSFGGGASFGNAYHFIHDLHWGQNGKFIYALAQWYSFRITQEQLQSFPSNTKLLVEIFNDDVTNDHRMAMDIFKTISIPDADKDFIMVKSDVINGYQYEAVHNLPNTSAAFDALDYYAYYRFIDALCDYTFNGSAAGKDTALGGGSSAQISMPGGLSSLVNYSSPSLVYPESKYEFPCSDAQNERTAYCPQITEASNALIEEIKIYPNPASNQLAIDFGESVTGEIKVLNLMQQVLISQFISHQNETRIYLKSLQQGIYFLSVNDKVYRIIKQD